jgi:hypothetical protein
MKTNDVLVAVVVGVLVIFLLFVVQGIIVSAGKAIKNFSLPGFNAALPGDTTNNSQANSNQQSNTTLQERACPDTVVRDFLVKTGRLAEPYMTTDMGSIQGIVYGQLRCKGSVIVSDPRATVPVGLFPEIPARDFEGRYYYKYEPIVVTGCTAGSDPCYRFDGVAPGVYSVLAYGPQGWYCDRGQCRVTVGGGFRQLFDIALP